MKAAKRQAALDAAFAVFREQGFAEATLQQVAARGGMSTATLFKHFPTKASLFEAIVTEAWEFDDQIIPVPARGDMFDDLLVIGRNLAAKLGNDDMLALYRVFLGALQTAPELGQVMLKRGKLTFVDQFGKYLALRGFKTVKDLPAISSQFIAMIADRVFWPRLLVPGNVVTDREVARAVRQACLTIVARLDSCEA